MSMQKKVLLIITCTLFCGRLFMLMQVRIIIAAHIFALCELADSSLTE